MLAEDVVLRFHHTRERAHQHATFAGQIAEYTSFLKCGWE